MELERTKPEDPVCPDSDSKRCDVLFLTASLSGGGAERKCVTLANAFSEKGYFVTVLTTSPESDKDYRLDPGVSRIAMPDMLGEKRDSWSRIRALLHRIRIARHHLRKLHPKHVVSLGHPEGLLAFLCKPSRSAHCIWTMLSSQAPESQDLRYRLLFRLARRRNTLVVTQTKSIEEEYRSAGFTNLITIPNPVFIPSMTSGEQRVERTFRIISVGRLVPQKSYETLIESLAILDRTHTEWQCTIVGNGPEREALERKCRSCGVASKVLFPGWVKDVRELIGRSDAFVLTSLFEGQPNALLEAMSESIPCIATNFKGGAAMELLGSTEAGVVVPVGDTQGIANAIQSLIKDPRRRRELGARGRKTVEAFGVGRISEVWEATLGLEPRDTQKD